jgi:hypothetical protein
MNKFKKLIIIFFLAFFVCLSFSVPKKAEAQWITVDVVQSAKEYGLDSIAFIIANAVLQRVTASTVNWINTGFKGSPAFVSNPEQYFTNLGNGIAGQALYNNKNTRFMCSSFSAKVQIALTQSYRNDFNFQCTLTDVGRNFDNFMSDFSRGGWDSFIQVTQNSANNPIGLFNSWNNDILNKKSSALQNKQQELNQGRGFLSVKKCEQWSEPLSGDTPTSLGNIIGGDFSEDGVPLDTGDPTDYADYDSAKVTDFLVTPQRKCLKTRVDTPGAVIQGKLDDTLGTGEHRLVVADELNEIISALLNQLVSKALGGLRSLSSPGSGSGSTNSTPSFADQLGHDADIQSTTQGSCPVLGTNEQGTLNADGVCVANTNPLVTSCDTPDGGKGTISLTAGSGCVPNEGTFCNTRDASGVITGQGVWTSGACLVQTPPPADEGTNTGGGT